MTAKRGSGSGSTSGLYFTPAAAAALAPAGRHESRLDTAAAGGSFRRGKLRTAALGTTFSTYDGNAYCSDFMGPLEAAKQSLFSSSGLLIEISLRSVLRHVGSSLLFLAQPILKK